MVFRKDICDRLSDEELVAKSLVHRDYFCYLYKRYKARLLRYIHRITHVNSEEAGDILQDAFIKVWEHLKEFDPKLKFSSWIFRVVHNETISHWRNNTSYSKDHTTTVTENLPSKSAEELTTALEIDEKQHRVHDLLELLPIDSKVVLILKYFQGMSYQEISDVLKIPEGTVAIRLNRAKKRFLDLAVQEEMAF